MPRRLDALAHTPHKPHTHGASHAPWCQVMSSAASTRCHSSGCSLAGCASGCSRWAASARGTAACTPACST